MCILLGIFGGLLLLLIAYLVIFFKYGYVDCDNSVCLVGKIAVVTGGSSGVGYQIVLSLASRGCRVIIGDKVVNENIKQNIIEETCNSNIELHYVDFGSFTSVRNFAQKLNSSEKKLDILVNNVGIGKAPENLSEDGLNLTWQINHYSPFLLTHLLINLLKKSNDGRIIFTSTIAAFLHNMTPDVVTSDSIKMPRFRMHDYANAKFCTIVATDIFAEKLKKFNLTCNAYHPGVAQSNFFKNTRENLNYFSLTDVWAYLHIYVLGVFFGVPPRKAAQAGINLAVSKKFQNTTGIFFGKYWPSLKPKLANDRSFCDKIWKASEKIVQLRADEKL